MRLLSGRQYWPNTTYQVYPVHQPRRRKAVVWHTTKFRNYSWLGWGMGAKKCFLPVKLIWIRKFSFGFTFTERQVTTAGRKFGISARRRQKNLNIRSPHAFKVLNIIPLQVKHFENHPTVCGTFGISACRRQQKLKFGISDRRKQKILKISPSYVENLEYQPTTGENFWISAWHMQFAKGFEYQPAAGKKIELYHLATNEKFGISAHSRQFFLNIWSPRGKFWISAHHSRKIWKSARRWRKLLNVVLPQAKNIDKQKGKHLLVGILSGLKGKFPV